MKNKEAHVFYFTYAQDAELSGHPYSGGWSIVEAPNMGAAAEIFRAIHPDKHPGRLNCAHVYSCEVWGTTEMAQHGSNFGHAAREKISWEVYGDE